MEKDWKAHWNLRFAEEEYAYGTEPNVFFAECLEKYNLSGDILFPNEGEGRNAVYAARKGLNVSAFDMSEEGKKKALKLARDNDVEVNYVLGEFSECEYEEESFDAIVLVFAHYPSSVRKEYHKKLITYLKKNGLIILVGFSEEHLEYNSINPSAGGPKNIKVLYSLNQVKNDFAELETQELNEDIVVLAEGAYHKGESSVITFVGKRL
jgi:Methyltransferase domain